MWLIIVNLFGDVFSFVSIFNVMFGIVEMLDGVIMVMFFIMVSKLRKFYVFFIFIC